MFGSKRFYDYIWAKWGTNAQIDMVFEEQSELNLVILKARRHNQLSTEDTRKKLAEKIADNIIVLEGLINHYRIEDEVCSNIAYKLSRTAERAGYTGDKNETDQLGKDDEVEE
jgi:S-adenosylmethionine synthetase